MSKPGANRFESMLARNHDFAGRTLEGVASADEKLASAVSLTLNEDPGTMLFVRRDTAPAQADLAGAWVMFAWGRNPAVGAKAIASVAGVTIDAAGCQKNIARQIVDGSGDAQ